MTTSATRSATLNSANAIWSFGVGTLESDNELSDRFIPVGQAQRSSGSFAEAFASFAEELMEEMNEELKREAKKEVDQEVEEVLIQVEDQELIEEEDAVGQEHAQHHPQKEESIQNELEVTIKIKNTSPPSKSAPSTPRRTNSQLPSTEEMIRRLSTQTPSSRSVPSTPRRVNIQLPSTEEMLRRLSPRKSGATTCRRSSKQSACWDATTRNSLRSNIPSSQSQPLMKYSFYKMTREECQQQLQSSFHKLDSYHSLRSSPCNGDMSHSTSATSLTSWGMNSSRHSSCLDDSVDLGTTTNNKVEAPLMSLLRAELTDSKSSEKAKSTKSKRAKSKTRKGKDVTGCRESSSASVSSRRSKSSTRKKSKRSKDEKACTTKVESSSSSVSSGRSSKTRKKDKKKDKAPSETDERSKSSKKKSSRKRSSKQNAAVGAKCEKGVQAMGINIDPSSSSRMLA